jgi:hypothetical protein
LNFGYGKKFWMMAVFFILAIFMFFLITQVVPILIPSIPSGFVGWFYFFVLCLEFFFFYAVYKSF